MTKKNYIAIARIIKDIKDANSNADVSEILHVVVDSLSQYFEEDNKLYDEDRFFNACGFKTDEQYCQELTEQKKDLGIELADCSNAKEVSKEEYHAELDKEAEDRIDGLVNTNDLQNLKDLLWRAEMDLIADGFEKEDIRKFFKVKVNEFLK